MRYTELDTTGMKIPPNRVQQNIDALNAKIPHDFLPTLKAEGLIEKDYPYLSANSETN